MTSRKLPVILVMDSEEQIQIGSNPESNDSEFGDFYQRIETTVENTTQYEGLSSLLLRGTQEELSEVADSISDARLNGHGKVQDLLVPDNIEDMSQTQQFRS